MKNLLCSALLVLSVALLAPSYAAEIKTAPVAPKGQAPAKVVVAGEYSGTWKGKDSSSGDLRLKIKQEAGTWVAEARFTFEGNEIPTKMKSIQVDGAKVELIFGWEIQGTASQSKLNGELKGERLEGVYESTSQEGAASGTWTVTRA